MSKRILLVAAALVVLLLAAQVGLVLTASPMRPVRVDPVLPDSAATPVDAQYEIARTFAPWIFHETHSEFGRQDIPAAMDFDGDLVVTDNWEDMPRHELVPTVYYTVVETETHYVVSYHLYHPRDWATFELGLQDTHEGDGENVQVVADKARMEAVLLTTQAHLGTYSYAPLLGSIRSGEETLRGEYELIVGHPAVYVESGGHGIYGSYDPRAANRLARIGHPIITYTPPENGSEAPHEPLPPWNMTSAPYRLLSLPALLGNSTDHPDLFAKYVGDTPRFHRGDRYSGPLGDSRGISPFAIGYGRSRAELGTLFWEPGARYAEALEIQGNWSTTVVAHPFRT